MRNAICFLALLFGSWSSSLGQSAPRITAPQIVATFQRLNQTADIPLTTIHTPKNWGTFRISIVMVLTVANGNDAAWDGAIQFADASGENGPYLPFEATLYAKFRPQTSFAEFPIRAKAHAPIKFSVKSDGDTSGSKYNVWVVVEQLM